jgi:hypothetical protein
MPGPAPAVPLSLLASAPLELNPQSNYHKLHVLLTTRSPLSGIASCLPGHLGVPESPTAGAMTSQPGVLGRICTTGGGRLTVNFTLSCPSVCAHSARPAVSEFTRPRALERKEKVRLCMGKTRGRINFFSPPIFTLHDYGQIWERQAIIRRAPNSFKTRFQFLSHRKLWLVGSL